MVKPENIYSMKSDSLAAGPVIKTGDDVYNNQVPAVVTAGKDTVEATQSAGGGSLKPTP